MDKFINSETKNDLNFKDIKKAEKIENKDIKKHLKQKYLLDYLKFGFDYKVENDVHLPVCIICGIVLSNEFLVPNKLNRHLISRHPSNKNKPIEYFKKLKESFEKSANIFKKCIDITEVSMNISYKIAELIVKKKKPHIIGEELIMPACRIIITELFGKQYENDVANIPISNDTIRRRIADMSANIESEVCKNIYKNIQFALQLDESTDISTSSQLICFVRFIHNKDFIEQFLFCNEL